MVFGERLGQFDHVVAELIVLSLLLQQLPVVAPLDDAALLQHQNGLGIADGGELLLHYRVQ